MSDLISRQALCEYALNQKDKSVTPNDIMRFPSAQPESCEFYDTESHFCALHRPPAQSEIVRCKDCKYWDKTWTNDWAKDYHYCPNVDGVRKADFYCADAERREE